MSSPAPKAGTKKSLVKRVKAQVDEDDSVVEVAPTSADFPKSQSRPPIKRRSSLCVEKLDDSKVVSEQVS